MNNNLHCHIGRAFTLDEHEDKFKAARESISLELTEALMASYKRRIEKNCVGGHF
jgi:hypothetical protein